MKRVWFVLCAVVLFGLTLAIRCEAESYYAYVANIADNTLHVVRISDSQVIATAAVGVDPHGVAISPDRRHVYVTNRTSGTVSFIDTFDYDSVAYVDVIGTPFGVAVSPDEDGRYVFVTDSAGNTVSVIDTQNENRITLVGVGNRPRGIAVSPLDGEGKYYVYVAKDSVGGFGTVSVISVDTASDPPTWQANEDPITVGTAPAGVAVSPDGDYLYVANYGDTTISVIDLRLDPPTVVTDIAVGDTPRGIAVSPLHVHDEGEYFFVYAIIPGGGNGGGSVAVIRKGADSHYTTSYVDVDEPVSFGQFIGSLPPPEPPSILDITAESDTKINLSWSYDSAEHVSGFRIDRKTGSDSNYVEIARIDPNVEEYQYRDQDVVELTNYTYRVTAYNNSGESESEDKDATTLLGAPSDLSAEAASSSQINLSWTDNSGAESGFSIERKTQTGGDYAEIDTVGEDVQTYSDNDSNLEEFTTYYYQVTAYNDEGIYSDPCQESSATTSLATPSGLSAKAVSGSRIDLSWTDNSDEESGYRIERKISIDGVCEFGDDCILAGGCEQIDQVDENVETYSDTNVDDSTSCCYRVVAFRREVSGGDALPPSYSNEATATTPFATPTGLSAQAVSDSEIDLSWTYNSNQAAGMKLERIKVSDESDSSDSFAEIATLGPDTTGYRDTNLEPYTTYRYRAMGYKDDDNSDYSNEAEARTEDDAICFISTAACGPLW